jgi:hypothetical protein
MKKYYLVASLLILTSVTFAQQNPPPPPRPNMGEGPSRGRFFDRGPKGGPNREKIELFKIQFITEKLGLTTLEAEQFWPVYESHKKAMKEIIENKNNDEIQMQEAMLIARKKYKVELKPVLKSDDRVNEALKIDRAFLQKVRNELMRRKGFQS